MHKVRYHLPLLPRSVIRLRCYDPASNEDSVLENEMAITKSWTKCAEGDLYGDIEELPMDEDGYGSWPTHRRQIWGSMVAVVDKMDIGV